MGKSLAMTLLKRHVNIYSDLYTLCFLHSYVQSPQLGLGPRARHCSQPLPPCPLVPSIWSAKQISIGINKPTAPSLWSRSGLQPRPEAEASTPYYCSLEDEAPATGTQGLMGDGEADKTNTS